MTKEQKKAAMLNYLKQQGTVFEDLISSSEKKVKLAKARGQYSIHNFLYWLEEEEAKKVNQVWMVRKSILQQPILN